MALSDDLRAELAGIRPTRQCDALAELSALFHTAGTVHLRLHCAGGDEAGFVLRRRSLRDRVCLPMSA